MIRAVIFDMDGVLIDSEIVYLRHQKKKLEPKYPWIKESDLYPLVGMDNNEDKYFMADLLGGNAEDPSFLQELKEVYSGVEVSDPEIMRPVVPSLLKSLKERGLKTALASSSHMDNILKVLTSCKIRDFFDCVVSGEQFVQSKPDPEIYFHVMKTLGVQPEECLIIEDSTYGVTAAHRTGACVLALKDDRFCFDQSLADHRIDSLEEVLQYI